MVWLSGTTLWMHGNYGNNIKQMSQRKWIKIMEHVENNLGTPLETLLRTKTYLERKKRQIL
jgi:hypothetical protein